MNEELEKLIDLALADGQLTDKERQVLFKKAEKLGVDMDEFEMVLDAKLFQKTNQATTTTQTATPKTDKVGDLKKCPSCGAAVSSFSTKCSDCGHEFRNVESNKQVREFFSQFQKIENSIPLKEAGGLLGGLLTDAINKGNRNRELFTKKKEFITQFPIPNTKEEIIEFLSMAVPLAMPAKKSMLSGFKSFSANFGDDHAKNFDYLLAKVWLQKVEQLMMKAKFSMQDDKKSLEEVRYYANQLGLTI